ncbi:ABC transporter ATP-binding protein [Microbacterium sp. LMI1-1-1.1]|uniref:ABC transporter ATP-binding protein n=1 Tax=Microbacterium sp. LMI1-1-1.1 TaxID=3135223 RepID=UPI003465C507
MCLVGPNGSGKTTLIECVEGLRLPDAGRIELFGHTGGSRRERAKMLGVQLQEEGLPGRIRVAEAVLLYAAIYGVGTPDGDLIARLGLEEFSRRPFETLSGGQKRRTALALAFIHDPRLVILDEPSAGLDPEGHGEILRLLTDRASTGVGMLVTTHDMQVAAEVAHRVVVMSRGRTIAAGTPADLLAALPHEWCLTGIDAISSLPTASAVSDGRSARIYGPVDELRAAYEALTSAQRVRATLRRTDLSDIAFLGGVATDEGTPA